MFIPVQRMKSHLWVVLGVAIVMSVGVVAFIVQQSIVASQEIDKDFAYHTTLDRLKLWKVTIEHIDAKQLETVNTMDELAHLCVTTGALAVDDSDTRDGWSNPFILYRSHSTTSPDESTMIISAATPEHRRTLFLVIVLKKNAAFATGTIYVGADIR